MPKSIIGTMKFIIEIAIAKGGEKKKRKKKKRTKSNTLIIISRMLSN